MGVVKSALLYTVLAVVANAAAADPGALEAMREGDMRKLTVHTEPQPVAEAAFDLAGGGTGALSDYAGKVVLVNFWATWCAPCRQEMPHLAALQTEFGGEDFEVVTIATGRNPEDAMQRFFDEIGVDNLPLHRDPKQALAREMGVLGLPISVLIDRDGQEIARLQGDADWASDSAKAIVAALIADGAEG